MTVSAHDVAREIRQQLPRVGILKLQKLLYYCQGWYIAWTDAPLFGEQIEAWANGPVVADFWHDENKNRGTPAPSQLDARGTEIVTYVLARYGRLSGEELRELTHKEAPWLEASRVDEYNPPISADALRQFFLTADGLAEEMEQAAERRRIHSVSTRVTPERRAAIDRMKSQLTASAAQLGA